MPGGQRGPVHVERLAEERLGLGGAAGRFQQDGQVVEADGDVRMPGGQRGPEDVERLAVERLGLGVAGVVDCSRLARLSRLWRCPDARRAARPGGSRAPRGRAARPRR